jgi:Mg2+/Co2+ transporter CorC
VNDALGTDLRAEEVESIGGLIYEKLGRIPVVGDEVHEDHAVLTVTGAEGRRVTWVRVKKLPDELSNGTAAAKSAAEEE